MVGGGGGGGIKGVGVGLKIVGPNLGQAKSAEISFSLYGVCVWGGGR